jgi:hypothetical protein
MVETLSAIQEDDFTTKNTKNTKNRKTEKVLNDKTLTDRVLLNDSSCFVFFVSLVVILFCASLCTWRVAGLRRSRRIAPSFANGAAEGGDFFVVEGADGAGWQVAEADRADGDAFEALHLVAEPGQQAADFAVAAFVEHHFEERGFRPPGSDLHVLGVGDAFGQVDAVVQFGEHVALNLSGHLDLIDFLDAVAGMGEPVGQLAVVGHEDQSFARYVEPTNAKNPRRVGRKQVGDAWPAGRVARRADDADRLVDGKVDELGLVQ